MLWLLAACPEDDSGACSLAMRAPSEESWSDGAPVEVWAEGGPGLRYFVDGVEVATVDTELLTRFVPEAEGDHLLQVRACGLEESRRVRVDWTDPVLRVESRVEGDRLSFTLEVEDANPLSAGAWLDGQPVRSPVRLEPGDHELEAWAMDAAGNLAWSRSTVSPAASLRIDSPEAGAALSGEVRVAFSADGEFTSFDLYLDDAWQAQVGADARLLDWDSCAVGPGAHELRLRGGTPAGEGIEAAIPVLLLRPDADGDGADACGDCDEADPGVHPGAVEVCANGVDDDCDGSAAGCGPAGELDLSDALRLYRGPDAHFSSDSPVRVADLDFDGVEELVFGDPFTGLGAEYGGVVWIVEREDTGLAEARARIGLDGLGYAGTALAVGDSDGDGRAELAIGVPGATLAVGEVAWFATAPGEAGAIDEADQRILGLEVGAGVGDGLEMADVDGDGLDELLVGAASASTGRGRVFVVREPATAVLDNGESVVGASTGDGVGNPGGYCADDFDGDGDADLLVGSFGDAQHAAWIVPGPLSGEISTRDLDLSLLRASDGDLGGASVGCGDLDGDGIGDALVGAPFDDVGGSMAGAFYAALGPFGGSRALAAADVQVHGDATVGYVGYDFAVGDYDDDGAAELWVGAPTTGEPNAGALFYFDEPLGADRLDEAAAHVAGAGWAGLGWRLAEADLDDDGVSDLLAPIGDPSAVAVFGGASW